MRKRAATSYGIGWDRPGKLLRLQMTGDLSVEAFVDIDRQITTHLRAQDEQLILLVDASAASISPYSIEQIRTTQTYLQSPQIERLVVISNNKLNRLTMLLLFNLCRPPLQFYESFEQAQRFLSGYAVPAVPVL
ncbi:MAG: hypothetical protein ACUVS2_10510 [Candidatus Flexifilum sp.]|jgi:hypothetical protein